MAERGAWSLQAVINQAAGLTSKAGQPSVGSKRAREDLSSNSSSCSAAFIPAATWQGPKPGFFFSRGKQGQGYYRDPLQPVRPGEQRGEEEAAGGLPSGSASLPPTDPEELLRRAEEQAHVTEIQALDARGVKRIVASLEKKYKENLELRLKHPDAPDRFLESEVDLDEQVKILMQVAGSPELYPVLVEANPFPTLLACLGHENADIAGDTLEVLRELTDADAVEEFGEEVRGLVAGLLEANALELLVQRLVSLNEKVEEEAKAVFNCLSVFENLVEVDPSIAEQVVARTELLPWLLSRLEAKEFDGNKQQASELLAVLVQGQEPNLARLRKANGVDRLLQRVSVYKDRDPGTADEEEYLQNCFDVLCALTMDREGKASFMAAEGVELMWILLGAKRQARYGALRLLDYVCTGFGPAAERFVDLGGLKYLFGTFMGKSKIKGPKGERDTGVEVEERCLSLIAGMLAQMGDGKAGRRERLAAKFVEAEFEKTDRLMELFFRYQDKVAACEKRLMEEEEDASEPLDDDEVMEARVDAGLFPLQQAALLLGMLWAMRDAGLCKRLLSSLHMRGQSLGIVRDLLVEYRGQVAEEAEGQKEGAQRLLARVDAALLAMGGADEQRPSPANGPGSKSKA